MFLCLAAAGGLTACNGDAGTPAGAGGADGGSGGQGGSAGQGASTGEGASTPAGSGGGSNEECPPCAENEVCILGQCTPVEEITLTAAQSTTLQGDGQSLLSGVLSACERPLNSAPAVDVLAEEGDCRVLAGGPPMEEEEAPSFGKVVASAPSLGSVGLLVPGYGGSCARHTFQAKPEYLADETVIFQVGAGTYTPDFEVEVTSPPLIVVTGDATFKKGAPFEVSWDSGDAVPTIHVFLLGGQSAITCTPSQGTSLTIPASLTAMLEGPGTGALVGGILRVEGPKKDLALTFQTRGVATRSFFRVVPIEQP
jgi:hypothetical protein